MLINRRACLTSVVEALNKDKSKDQSLGRGLRVGSNGRRKTVFGLVLGLVLLASVLSLVPAVLSAPGHLDLTFNACEPGETQGCGGKSVLDIGDEDYARAVAIQPDGKIVLAGQRGRMGGGFGAAITTDFALARFNLDGSIDTAFGNNGIVTTDFGGSEQITALALQADGKIVAGGNVWGNDPTEGPDADFGVARYNADGSPDLDFGLAGKVTTDWTYQEALSALVIQPDGKIVAAGPGIDSTVDTTRSRPGRQPGDYEIGLVRYEATGVLDPSFGGDGVAPSKAVGVSGVFFNQGTAMLSLAMQEESYVLAGAGNRYQFGTCDTPCPMEFALARLKADGSADTSFGTNGLALNSVGPGSDEAMAVALHEPSSDNQGLVAVGVAQDCVGPPSACQSDFAVARYSKDGLLDQSWGEGGKATADFGGYDFATSVGVQADGGVVVAGSTCASPYRDCQFALTRYSPGGVLDGSFGNRGKVVTDILEDADEIATGIAVHPDSRIIAAGGGPGDFLTAAYVDRLVDLSMIVTDTPDPVLKSDPLTYEVSVKNSGEEAAENVVLSATLAGPLRYESAKPAQGTCLFAAPVLTCQLGKIEGNTSLPVSVRAIAPPTLQELTTSFQVSTPTFETHKADNQTVEVTRVTQLPPILPKGTDPVVDLSGVQPGSDKIITPQPPGSAPAPPAPPAGSSLPTGASAQGSAVQLPGPPPTGASAPAPPVVEAGITQAASQLPGASPVPSSGHSVAGPAALGAYPLSFEPESAQQYLMVGRSPFLPYASMVFLVAAGGVSAAGAICIRRRADQSWHPRPGPALARA